MNQLVEACENASQYPLNFKTASGRYLLHQLDDCSRRFNEKQADLLCGESKTAVDFLQCDYVGQPFKEKRVCNLHQLKDHLRLSSGRRHYDPLCRFVFLHAPNSRSQLSVSKEVLQYILTYHRVAPKFLDLLYSFGKCRQAHDFHYTGFLAENHLASGYKDLPIPELDRSGETVQIAYSLRGVEASKGHPTLPWSIRPMVILHNFDFRKNQSTWIVVKAEGHSKIESSMRHKIVKNLQFDQAPAYRSIETVKDGFQSGLIMHQQFAEWAGDNWRWYINALEELAQKELGPLMTADVFANQQSPGSISRAGTAETTPSQKASRTSSLRFLSFIVRKARNFGAVDPAPLGRKENDENLPDPSEEFSWDELRHTENLQEKVDEAMLVVKANSNILTTLSQHFESISASKAYPDSLRSDCYEDIDRFSEKLRYIIKELAMQEARLHTLHELVAGRKALLLGVIEYGSMQASVWLAKEAKDSAIRTETMTMDMHTFADKSKRDAEAMKIITVVTLVFLPATFVSTFMSTDVVKFRNKDTNVGIYTRLFSRQALILYFEVTLPLTVFTLMASWLALKWLRRRERNSNAPTDEEKSPQILQGDHIRGQ